MVVVIGGVDVVGRETIPAISEAWQAVSDHLVGVLCLGPTVFPDGPEVLGDSPRIADDLIVVPPPLFFVRSAGVGAGSRRRLGLTDRGICGDRPSGQGAWQRGLCHGGNVCENKPFADRVCGAGFPMGVCSDRADGIAGPGVRSRGNEVCCDLAGGLSGRWGHLSDLPCEVGDHAGDIARVGCGIGVTDVCYYIRRAGLGNAGAGDGGDDGFGCDDVAAERRQAGVKGQHGIGKSEVHVVGEPAFLDAARV